MNVGFNEIICESWFDLPPIFFNAICAGQFINRKKFIFRGQRDALWPLKSTFDRWYDSRRDIDSDRIGLFSKMITDFTSEHQKFKRINANEDQFIALAQHYGLQTRLLDWTNSLYVAAFFAFENAIYEDEGDENVAIWCLNSESPIWKLGCPILDSLSSDENIRLRNQDGVFTMLNTPDDSLEEFVSKALKNKENKVLYKIVIPKSERKLAMSELELMQINHSKIYGDLTGIARFIRFKLDETS